MVQCKQRGIKENKLINYTKIYSEFTDIFSRFVCFKGTFKWQVREGSHQYQAPSGRVEHTVQEPLKE